MILLTNIEYWWWGIISLVSNSLTSVVICSAVKLNANRMIVGTLRGFDQFMNLVVDNTVEVNGNENNEIGMVVSLLNLLRS